MSEFQESVIQRYKKPFIADYPKAPLEKRFLAIFIDTLIIISYCFLAVIIFYTIRLGSVESVFPGMQYPNTDYNIERINNWENSIYLIYIALVIIPPLIYFLIKDSLGQGQSLGKRIVGIMVIDIENNSRCTIQKSIMRNFISLLLSIFVPFIGFLIEPTMIIASSKGSRLGDLASKVQVTDKKNINFDKKPKDQRTLVPR